MKKYQNLAFCGLFRWLKSKVSPAHFACPVRHFEHWFQSSRFQHHVTWIFFRVLKNFFQQKNPVSYMRTQGGSKSFLGS